MCQSPCRYEDNGDAVNNLLVICKPTGSKSIEDFGSPDKWLQENAKLLGEDVWKGATTVTAALLIQLYIALLCQLSNGSLLWIATAAIN